MAKFMFLGKGDAVDFSAMTPDQMQEWMAKWQAWMEKTGPSFTDQGAPFGAGTSLVDDGSRAAPVPLTGYSIVEAEDLEAAIELAAGHPYLSEGRGRFAMEVFELMPVPEQ